MKRTREAIDLKHKVGTKADLARFACRMTKLRTARGLSVAALARVAGVGRGALIGYEQGSYWPGFSTLIRLSQFFGVSLDELLDLPESVPEGVSDTVLLDLMRRVDKSDDRTKTLAKTVLGALLKTTEEGRPGKAKTALGRRQSQGLRARRATVQIRKPKKS